MFLFSFLPDENFGVIYLFPDVSLKGVRRVSFKDSEGVVVKEDFNNCFH